MAETESAERRPASIFFFPSGMVAVCDQLGEQMPKYQAARSHKEAIATLRADGYDWREIPDVMGQPHGLDEDTRILADRLDDAFKDNDELRRIIVAMLKTAGGEIRVDEACLKAIHPREARFEVNKDELTRKFCYTVSPS